MPTSVRGPSRIKGCRSADWCASSTVSRTKPALSICWATCSTSGMSGNTRCQRVSPGSSGRFPSSPTWAWRCTISPATTTFGCTVIWKKNVVSSCIASRSPRTSTERCSTWPTATDSATLTRCSTSSAASSTTAHASFFSPCFIPVGPWGLGSHGPSIRG